MNLQEEKTKLENKLSAITQSIQAYQVEVSVLKSRLKKLEKAIKAAEEALK